MPELPEVETVVRGLQAVLPGRRILEVRFGKTDFIADPAALELNLPGARISAVKRYGKFLLFELESAAAERPARELALLIHLGMTGQLVTGPPEARVAPHTHVFFALDDGKELRYTDIRRFGSMQLLVDGAREKALGSLGLDPLEMT
ncbi:MAG TPA: DNA-formamidopyrimidine glycosylase family protein, partial [Candidatus Acidoferrales bacterium]|nr:DNA-formamidopyrimidine glycosylase family protein [Candidatus Acidoferrales bacterium]